MPTSALSLAVKRCVAVRRICVDPQPRTMFSGLDAELLRDGVDEVAAGRRIASGRAAALAERRAHRLHDGLARPERVLVAAQADHARARPPRASVRTPTTGCPPGRERQSMPRSVPLPTRCPLPERIPVARAPCLPPAPIRVVRVIRGVTCRRWWSLAEARCGTRRSPSSFLPSCRARCARASSRAAGTAGPP